jgi:hypothetical protein
VGEDMTKKKYNRSTKRYELPSDLEGSLASLHASLRAEEKEESKKKMFKIACDWAECGEMLVEANSLEEAIKKAENDDDPLPDGDYIDGSFQVNKEVTELLQKADSKF